MGQKGQTFYLVDIRNIEFRDNTVIVRIWGLFKSSSPTSHTGESVLEGYTKDGGMCIFCDKISYCILTKKVSSSNI